MNFYIHKLGCPQNDVDADYIAARLIAEGHTPVSSPDRAESIIVNTCGIILEAKEESINEILILSKLKNSGTLKSLYAAECLTQRNGDELLKGIPELDGTFGHGALDSIAKAVSSSARFDKTIKLETHKLGYLNFRNRFISDDWPYSYLKISDGYNRPCTYCAIPKMRGRYQSRPLDSIIKEAEFLAQNGKKELILVSQEATLWGYDFKDHPNTITLLKALEQIDGINWIRLLYLYPGQVKDNLIEHMAEDNKTLNYYDLPLQHVNSDFLSRIKRLVDRPRIEKLLDNIRITSNDAVIRTTFIVGFPGETEKQFNELYDFVSENRLDRMGVFRYSPEDGTPAEKLSGQIREKVKIESNNNLIGTVQKVLVDEINSDGFAIGRTYADCPEIDQEVKIYNDSCQVGGFYNVLIDESEEYDLRGTVTGEQL